MALVYRNGHPYLYRSVRKGGRVTSEYRGSGETALIITLFDESEREEKAHQRAENRGRREEGDELEAGLDEITESACAAACGALIAAGYHQHKSQWRKRRGDRTREADPR